MYMAMKRAIPKVDPLSVEHRHHITNGEVISKADPTHNCVSHEIHKCTVFMNGPETISVILSLAKAGSSLWGESFITELEQWLEQMRGQ